MRRLKVFVERMIYTFRYTQSGQGNRLACLDKTTVANLLQVRCMT